MAYNEIFNISSSINLIQSSKTPNEEIFYTWNSPLDPQNRCIPSAVAAVSAVTGTGRKEVDRTDVDISSSAAENGIARVEMEISHLRPDGCSRRMSMTDSSCETTEVSASMVKDQATPGARFFHLCHCRLDLLPVKIFYFAFIGALGVVLPYCAVFLKQIGLGAYQIGLISGIRPALGFISAPLWGSLADRFGIRRIVMIFSMLAWLAFYVGFYFIESPDRLKDPYPNDAILHRTHLRLKRSAGSLADNESIYDVMTTTTSLHECNYSVMLSKEEQDLLKENISWIYDPSEVYTVFIVCLLIICGGELFQSPTTALTDAATLQVLGTENLNQYGAQRAWGPIGWAISSLVAGSLLSANRWTETICGIEISFSDYRIVAYVFIGIMIFGLAAAFKINFEATATKKAADEDDEGKKVISPVHSTLVIFKLFLNVHYGSWIMTAFYVGFLNGIIWGFLFWHIDNLGGSQLLMGIDGLVMCVFEFTAFFFVEHVIKLVGHMGIMYIGLIGYSIRYIIYASVTNPWYILPAEAMQGITFSFIWVSLTSYTAVAVPSVSLATVQGIMHGVYFGLGNGFGHLFGGILIGNYGAVITFYSFSGVTFLWLIVFFICQKFSKKPITPKQFSYQEFGTTTTETAETDDFRN